MWKILRKKKLGVRIMLGLFVGVLGIGMLLYLVPGQGTMGASAFDVVAEVDGAPITIADVTIQMSRIERSGGAIPQPLRWLYAQQILGELVFEKELGVEAQRLGIRVTDQERADRIRLLIPTAFIGDSFIGMDQYAAQVLTRYGVGVAEFEATVTQTLLQENFRRLMTDGITVSPAEIEQEFRRRNEKVKISYVVVNPDDLQSEIEASDADLQAYFEANQPRYMVPERRVVRYAFLDLGQVRSQVSVSDEEIRTAYNDRLDRYRIEDRAHVAHILLKTVGKTDAEVEETRKMAEDILKKTESGGANFADLAQQSSEDTTREQGGDLGWIVRGQTVPEFENVAFSLPKNAVSDLVKTDYGFHIIKVLDRQMARTQTLDEVRSSILAELEQAETERMAQDLAGQIAEEIRRSGRVPIDELGTRFNLPVEDTQPLEVGQSIPQVGNAPEIAEAIFRLRAGDISAPIRTDLGYVVPSIKQIQPAHPGALSDVREMVLADYSRDKTVEVAKSRAEELARRSQAGEDISRVAKSLGFEVQTSLFFARTEFIEDVGTASQIAGAFALPVGQTSDPVFLGTNWVVYGALDHQQADPDELAEQRQEITQRLLEQKRGVAFEAFRTSLEERMLQEGMLRYNEVNLERLTGVS